MSTRKFGKKKIDPTDAELRDAMDRVMARVTLDDIAKVAGCGVNTLKQARMDPDTAGYRRPPASLGKALHEVCRERARYFLELGKALRSHRGP